MAARNKQSKNPEQPTDPKIRRSAQVELARRCFYNYCVLCAPDFYRPERLYLKELCDKIQAFYESDGEMLVVNLPPRHGKSRTAALFAQWVLGCRQRERIMVGSYNKTLSTAFSKTVREAIRQRKARGNDGCFGEVFPAVTLKAGDSAAELWCIEGQYASFLATSPQGTATGFGCTLLLIDDLIKNAREAYDDKTLTRQWEWFSNTMLSRLEEGGKVIVVMTRWSQGDLAGQILANAAPKEGQAPNGAVTWICMKAVGEDGQMLCPEILSKRSYAAKRRAMGAQIAAANYQQEPLDLKDRLYSGFKRYQTPPRDDEGRLLFTRVRCYVDVADTGADYLCAICYGEYAGAAYLLDVLYTDAPMEQTEPQTARMLADCAAKSGYRLDAEIESNNGGRGFARAVERQLGQLAGGNRVRICTFSQSKNKQARILSNATWVCDNIYFPEGWETRWNAFYLALASYRRTGRNAHDDAPDALTGIAERAGTQETFSFD